MSVDRWFRPALRAAILRGEEPQWLLNHPRRAYVRQAVLATPIWVTRGELRAMVRLRDEATQRTGVEHVLDHIVPLNHPRICGLNVPLNLRVIPRATNAQKGGGWCEWQGDLFNSSDNAALPGQLTDKTPPDSLT